MAGNGIVKQGIVYGAYKQGSRKMEDGTPFKDKSASKRREKMIMKKTKTKMKAAGILVCTALAGALLAGCQGGTTESGGSPKKEAKEGKMTLVFAQDLDTNENANKAMKEVLKKYTEKTGVNIQFESLPSADYRTWLTTQFAADKGPDVYSGIIYDMTTDYQNGQLYNFKDLYDKESPYDKGKKWGDTLPDYIKERMYVTDKDVPGYPTATSVVRIFCNKSIFEKAGAKIPETWKEFMEACKKIKASGTTPFAFPNATIDDLSWLWFNNSLCSQLDSKIVKELDVSGNGYVELNEICKGMDQGKIDFKDPQLMDAFKLMKDFSKYWSSDYNGLDQKSAMEMFARGDAAMVQAMSINLQSIDSMVGSAFDYVVIPVPTVTAATNQEALGKSVILGGQPDIIYGVNKALTKDHKKLKAAIDFAQYMASPEVELKFAGKIGRIPLSTSTRLPEKLKGFTITEEPLRMPFFTGINEKLRNYFQRSGQEYLSGSISLNELADTMNKSYKEVLDEVKAENGWSADNNYGL